MNFSYSWLWCCNGPLSFGAPSCLVQKVLVQNGWRREGNARMIYMYWINYVKWTYYGHRAQTRFAMDCYGCYSLQTSFRKDRKQHPLKNKPRKVVNIQKVKFPAPIAPKTNRNSFDDPRWNVCGPKCLWAMWKTVHRLMSLSVTHVKSMLWISVNSACQAWLRTCRQSWEQVWCLTWHAIYTLCTLWPLRANAMTGRNMLQVYAIV